MAMHKADDLPLTDRPNAAAGSKALERRYKFKKRRQREDAIAAALVEAAAAADADQARLRQSQMLEALFELFFRVLKRCTASGLLQAADGCGPTEATVRAKFPLLYVALEGLGKYTHLIGLEYFTDLLDVFHQLLASSALPLGLRLRCLLSTVDILQAQGDALNVDRRQIYMHLYGALAECPLEDIEDVSDAEEYDDGTDDAAFRLSAAGDGVRAGEDSRAALVVKAASRLLGWLKVGDSARLGAFAKRLCSSALHAEPGLAVALVSIASRCVLWSRGACLSVCAPPRRLVSDVGATAQGHAASSEAAWHAGGRVCGFLWQWGLRSPHRGPLRIACSLLHALGAFDAAPPLSPCRCAVHSRSGRHRQRCCRCERRGRRACAGAAHAGRALCVLLRR